jgi:hypothetical protein
MNIDNFKRIGFSIALAAAFLVAAGSLSAFAQDSRYRDGYGRVDSRSLTPEERKGFNDGKIAGRRDAKAHLRYNPSGSIRYQLGGVDYRLAFQEGYEQEYRKFADNNEYRRDYRSNDSEYHRDYRSNDSYDIRGLNQNNLYRQGGYYDRSGNFHRY